MSMLFKPRGQATRNLVFVMIAVVIAFALPLLPGLSRPSNVTLMTTIAVAAYFAMSWNITGGMAGQMSFAHSIFLACGAYGSAVFFIDFGWNPLVGGLVGVVVAVVLAAGMTYLCARYGLSHLSFGLATAAFAMIGLYFVKGSDFLGGAYGLSLPVKASPAELYFTDPRDYYWLFLTLLLLVLFVTLLIRNSRLGTNFVAIREDEAAAAAIGVNVNRAKISSMMISAAMTAVGGAFYANYLRFIDPESLIGFNRSLDIVIPALLGGTTTIIGPIVGAVIYGFVVERSDVIIDIPGGSQIILGVMLAIVILLMPSGIVPTVRSAVSRYRDRRRHRSAASTPVTSAKAPADEPLVKEGSEL